MNRIIVNKSCRVCKQIPKNGFFKSKVKRADYICPECCKLETYRNRNKQNVANYVSEYKCAEVYSDLGI